MTTWSVGDYPRMAVRLEPAAHRVVEAAVIEASDTVLDVATGTGNAALLAAGRGARGGGHRLRADIAGHRLQAVLVSGLGGPFGECRCRRPAGSRPVCICCPLRLRGHVRRRPRGRHEGISQDRHSLGPSCPGIVGTWQLHAGHGSDPFAVPTATPGQLRTTEQMGRRRLSGGTRGPPLSALDGSFCRAAGAGLPDSGGGCGFHGPDCWPRDSRETPARQGAAVGCSPRRRPLADRDDGASNRRGNRHPV